MPLNSRRAGDRLGALLNLGRIAGLAAVVAAVSLPAVAETPPEEPDFDVEINLKQSVAPEELRAMEKQIADFARRIREASSEVALRAQIGSSPLLRQIVCRVPFHTFEVGALAGALGLPPRTVYDAAQLLERMGLVSIRQENQHRLLVPRSPEAEKIMRKWANEWCVNDETCGVEK